MIKLAKGFHSIFLCWTLNPIWGHNIGFEQIRIGTLYNDDCITISYIKKIFFQIFPSILYIFISTLNPPVASVLNTIKTIKTISDLHCQSKLDINIIHVIYNAVTRFLEKNYFFRNFVIFPLKKVWPFLTILNFLCKDDL